MRFLNPFDEQLPSGDAKIKGVTGRSVPLMPRFQVRFIRCDLRPSRMMAKGQGKLEPQG